jgi:hypothetical protein
MLDLMKEPAVVQLAHTRGVARDLQSNGDVCGNGKRYRIRGSPGCQVEHPALADARETPGEDDRAAREV